MQSRRSDVADSAPPSQFEVLCSIAAYVVCSIGMIILNKLVIGTHGFKFPFVLIFLQNGAAVVFVMTMRALGKIDYPPLQEQKVRRWLPITVCFIAMLATSLMSLSTLSVPAQVLIKNFAIITTAIGDAIFFSHPFNMSTCAAFALLMSGGVLGVTNDAWVTATGVFWAVANVLCTSGMQLYMKLVLNDLKAELGRWGPVYYNNVLSLPPLLLPVFYEWNAWTTALGKAFAEDHELVVYIVLSLAVSAFITMGSFWCMACTSPTTYGVIGGVNKIPMTVLGMVVFGQYPNWPNGYVGLAGAVAGGLLYTHAMNQAKKAPPVPEGRSSPQVVDVEMEASFSSAAAYNRSLSRRSLTPGSTPNMKRLDV